MLDRLSEFAAELRSPTPLMMAGRQERARVPLNIQIRQAGEALWRMVFQDNLETSFLDLLDGPRRVRLRLSMEDKGGRINLLPWETLYISGLRTHLGLTPKYSVVRGIKQSVSLGRHEMGYPTRILAVFANPVDTPPLAGIEHEEAAILGGLKPAVEDGRVELKVLSYHSDDGIPTRENIARMVRVFRPHVFHFVGHAGYSPGMKLDTSGWRWRIALPFRWQPRS